MLIMLSRTISENLVSRLSRAVKSEVSRNSALRDDAQVIVEAKLVAALGVARVLEEGRGGEGRGGEERRGEERRGEERKGEERKGEKRGGEGSETCPQIYPARKLPLS